MNLINAKLKCVVCLLSSFYFLAPSLAQSAPMPSSFNLSALDGDTGFVLTGDAVNDFSGFSLAGNFDINNDGIDDLAVGAYGADLEGSNRAGKVYVLFGETGVVSTGHKSVSTLNGVDGFEILGVEAESFAGWSVSGGGDVNSDGIDDLLIGAPDSDVGEKVAAGKVYVLFGSGTIGFSGSVNLASLDGSNGFVIHGVDVADRTGRAVVGGGDINDDGIDDILIGARGATPLDRSHAGVTYIVFGDNAIGSDGIMELSSLEVDDGLRISGASTDDKSGESVSFAGDVDDDGIDDLILGAPGVDAHNVIDTGAAYIIFGSASLTNKGEIDLANLSTSDGLILEGVDTLDGAGVSVSSAGDVNGDTIADIIVGADRANIAGNRLVGESYVVFGHIGIGGLGSLALSDLDGSNGFVIEGEGANHGAGIDVSGIGDVNGDGTSDIAVGAHGASPNGVSHSGAAYIVFGGSAIGGSGSLALSTLDGENGLALNGIQELDLSGNVISGVSDLNFDGIDDIAIGASTADPSGNGRAGESYVVFMPLPDTAEPNNIFANPTVININDVQSHSLAPAGDVDHFTFTLEQPTRIQIVTANNGTELDYDVELVLTDGQNNIIETSIDTSTSPYAELVATLPEGTFNFKVYSGLTSQVIPSYSIELSSELISTPMCNGLAITVDLNQGQKPGPGDDVILGTEGNDDIRGRAGNDTICGMGGDDFIHGNSGNDWIDGGTGIDDVRGGQGDDELYSGVGATVGSSARVFGGNGDDEIHGGDDADDLRGGRGEDIIYGNGGDDEITGNSDNDVIHGGAGDDDIRGGQGDDVLNGDSGDDFLSGGDGVADICDGGSDVDASTTTCETVINVP